MQKDDNMWVFWGDRPTVPHLCPALWRQQTPCETEGKWDQYPRAKGQRKRACSEHPSVWLTKGFSPICQSEGWNANFLQRNLSPASKLTSPPFIPPNETAASEPQGSAKSPFLLSQPNSFSEPLVLLVFKSVSFSPSSFLLSFLPSSLFLLPCPVLFSHLSYSLPFISFLPLSLSSSIPYFLSSPSLISFLFRLFFNLIPLLLLSPFCLYSFFFSLSLLLSFIY